MPENITSVLDRLEKESDGENEVAIQDVLTAFSGRLFGPLLFVPALIVLTPLGAIPFVPTSMAVLLLLIAVQNLFGREHPWVPRKLREGSVARDKFLHALEKVRPWAGRLDKLLRPRVDAVVAGPMRRVLTVIIIVLAAIMVPLELLPFAAAVPAAAIALLSLAVMAHDGLIGIIGLVFGGGAVGLVIYFFVFR